MENCNRKFYLTGADGEDHEVSELVYHEYKRLVWKERNAERRDRAAAYRFENPNYIDAISFPKVVSINSIQDSCGNCGDIIMPNVASAEDEAMKQICRDSLYESLYKALELLSEEERFLIDATIIGPYSIRDVARQTGVPRTSLQYKRVKVLDKLRSFIVNDIKGYSSELLKEAI